MSEAQASYRSILKSSSLIGGSSVINILIGMVRTKFIAVLLGPSGVGLIGVFGQIVSITATASNLGLGGSGVRQMAQAVAQNDIRKTSETVLALRRVSWVTGLFGLCILTFFCVPISHITFGHDRYAPSVAVLGLTILLGSIAAGQSCLLQGVRRIGDLAKINVIGALTGTAISIPCYYVWGEGGIVISMVLCSAAAMLTTWWFARRLQFQLIDLSWAESFGAARVLIMLGLSFVGAALVTSLSGYLIQMILVREISLNGAGLYQSAFTLSGLLVNVVLGALGTDYYPRLSAVVDDPQRIRQLLNEQTEISLFLALPCLIAMMVFSPLLIQLFYSQKFLAAIPVLQWCLLGVFGRVVSWPIGYVILAMGKGKLFFLTEAIDAGFHVCALWLLVKMYAISGAGIAFMLLYVFHLALMFFVVRKLIGPIWNRRSVLLVFGATIVMALMTLNCKLNQQVQSAWVISLTLLLATCWYCYRQLSVSSGLTVRSIMQRIRK